MDKITGFSSIVVDISKIPNFAKAIPGLSNVEKLD